MRPFYRSFLLVCLVCPRLAFAENSVGSTEFNVADRLAIRNVISAFYTELDSFHIDAWLALYDDDAEFIVIDSGKRIAANRERFEKIFRDRFANFRQNGDQRRHISSNFLIVSQSDDAAHAQVSGVLLNTNQRTPPEIVSTFSAEGWLAKRRGVWKIIKWEVRSDTDLNLQTQIQGARITDAIDD